MQFSYATQRVLNCRVNSEAATFVFISPLHVQMDSLVAFQVALLGEAFTAGQAAVRSLSGVDAAVGFQVAQLGEAAAAERAAERPLARVGLQVGLQVAGVGEALATLPTARELPGAGVELGGGLGGRVGVNTVGRLMLGFEADPRGAGSIQTRGVFGTEVHPLHRQGSSSFKWG